MNEINNFNMQEVKPHKSESLGPIVGIILIIVILLIGALYYWGSAKQEIQIDKSNETIDDVDQIEADLNSINPDSIDADLNIIDKDLDSGV